MRDCAHAARRFAVVLAALVASAPLSAQPISDVEVTAEGLHRIDPDVMPLAWLNPDADLTQYTRAFVMRTIVQYRDMQAPSQFAWSDRSRTAFPLSEHMQQRLQETFGESFVESMDAQRDYEVVRNVGRDVVLVQGYLTDVATGMPLDLAGSDVDFIRWAWEANLVVELRDSMSNDVLFRAIDRQRVEGPVDPDTLYGLALLVSRQWSRVMVDRVQELSTFYPSRLYRLQERARDSESLD